MFGVWWGSICIFVGGAAAVAWRSTIEPRRVPLSSTEANGVFYGGLREGGFVFLKGVLSFIVPLCINVYEITRWQFSWLKSL